MEATHDFKLVKHIKPMYLVDLLKDNTILHFYLYFQLQFSISPECNESGKFKAYFSFNFTGLKDNKTTKNGYRRDKNFNPLNPHDASKHLFASLINDLISIK